MLILGKICDELLFRIKSCYILGALQYMRTEFFIMMYWECYITIHDKLSKDFIMGMRDKNSENMIRSIKYLGELNDSPID